MNSSQSRRFSKRQRSWEFVRNRQVAPTSTVKEIFYVKVNGWWACARLFFFRRRQLHRKKSRSKSNISKKLGGPVPGTPAFNVAVRWGPGSRNPNVQPAIRVTVASPPPRGGGVQQCTRKCFELSHALGDLKVYRIDKCGVRIFSRAW